MLYDNEDFATAHQSVAELGDTTAPSASDGDRLGQHFVAFVKEGGRLWELEGSRVGDFSLILSPSHDYRLRSFRSPNANANNE